MKETVFISANKEAAPKVRSGSYADGFADQSVRLPFTVMGSHVNLPATGHSEMASDIDRFSGCFLALCAKTLSEANFDLDSYFHIEMKFTVCLRAGSGLSRVRHPHYLKIKRSICLSTGRRSVTSALESVQNFMKIKIQRKCNHYC